MRQKPSSGREQDSMQWCCSKSMTLQRRRPALAATCTKSWNAPCWSWPGRSPVCTGNTAQAETEKTEFLHYAAVQPDPNAVLLALLAPATATVVIIKAITIINDMYIPYLYMPKNKLRTLTTFLMDYANAQQGSWQTLAAGIIVIMLPTILIYVFFQRYILAGIAAGAVKE